MAIKFDYSRGGRQMSSRRAGGFIVSAGSAVLLAASLAATACAQYPGQVTKSSKENPELRAISVLEWTGEAGKPKTSRLVPVAVLDEGQLQDGGIYLARPQPLALAGEVEYELQQDGKPIGLFDIKNTGQEQGSWVGYGTWNAMPAARPKPSARQLASTRIDDDAQSDQPVLHRKHHADDASAGGKGSDGGSGGQAQASDSNADPDRPTLHKKASSGNTSDASGSTTPTDSSASDASDPDRPTLHKKTSSGSAGGDSGSASAPSDDPDRPVLKKAKKKQPEDLGHVDSLPEAEDPDRPRLKRGKSSGGNLDVVPSLMGLPPDLQQAVAVSDAKTRPAHLWDYAWANPDDEEAMKSALEDIARKALGLNPPAPKTAPRRTATARRSAKPAPTAEPAPLANERFRVFELAYGSGATLVLTAHTDGPLDQQKFVTLIAQPDLYGNVLVLLKSVTDGDHLDETPRMRLVDAVDAMADNRGELLFELRGATQRQFALYRVLRGQAEKLFVSGGGEFGTESKE